MAAQLTVTTSTSTVNLTVEKYPLYDGLPTGGYEGTAQDLKDDIDAITGGFQGEISISDTPTEIGYYYPTESGTYTNADGLVVDLTDGVTILIFDGTDWGMQVVPVDVIYNSGELDPESTDKAETGLSITNYFLEDAYIKKNTGIFVNAYINSLGVVINSANWRTDADFTPVQEGEKYRYIGNTSLGGSARSVAGYDGSGTFVSILVANADYTSLPSDFTIPTGVTQVKSCSYNTYPPEIFLIQKILKPSLFAEEPAETNKIIINKSWGAIGTSITAVDESSKEGYQTRVREIFEFSGYSKYGYSGHSLGGLTNEDTSSLLEVATTDTWVSCDIYSFETITNDFKRNIPIGVRDDYDDNTGITTYYGALRVLKDKLISLNPDAIIIAANGLRRNNLGYTSISVNTVGATMLDYEVALMDIAEENNWRFIDQFREGGINDDNLASTTTDGLHPNNFGYRLVSKIWIGEFWLLSKTDNE